MREPIEYISGEILEKCYGYSEDVLLAIKEAQKDAYKEGYNRAMDFCTDSINKMNDKFNKE